MWHLINRVIYYWKSMSAAMILLYVLIILVIDFEDFNLTFDAANKAPFFALCSAATLFIGMIPKKPGVPDAIVDVIVRIVGAISACLAAWFWLLGETQGDTLKYLLLLSPILTLYGLVIILGPFLAFFGAGSSNERPGTGPTEDE